MKRYGISNPHYTKTFNTMEELVRAVKRAKVDPNYEITVYGYATDECLSETSWFRNKNLI